MKNKSHPLKNFLILWSTQSVSQLGSSITAFALTLWLYETTGSSLSTAALTICSYTPYVLMSIFAGVLTDRLDKKKIMLVCDLLAVLCTIAVFALFRTNHLMVWHLYALNIISGLMNTVQQPASEVAMTLIIPEQYYQKTSALRSLSRSLISILNPLIATALYAFAGLNGVVAADVGSFIIAFTECQAEHAMLRNLFLILLLVGVVALTVAFLISLSSANRSIKPVEESYNKQKQFVADASHELKTPLTTINTNVDVLLSHQENTIGEEKKWLDYIKRPKE